MILDEFPKAFALKKRLRRDLMHKGFIFEKFLEKAFTRIFSAKGGGCSLSAAYLKVDLPHPVGAARMSNLFFRNILNISLSLELNSILILHAAKRTNIDLSFGMKNCFAAFCLG